MSSGVRLGCVNRGDGCCRGLLTIWRGHTLQRLTLSPPAWMALQCTIPQPGPGPAGEPGSRQEQGRVAPYPHGEEGHRPSLSSSSPRRFIKTQSQVLCPAQPSPRERLALLGFLCLSSAQVALRMRSTAQSRPSLGWGRKCVLLLPLSPRHHATTVSLCN